MGLKTDVEVLVVGTAVLALAVFFYVKAKGGVAKLAPELGRDLGDAAVKAVDGVLGGATNAIGDMFGVPRTDESLCAQYMASGQTWKAGLYCPAGTFLPYLMSGSASAPLEAVDSWE